MSAVVDLNDQNFQSEVLEYKDTPVLVDFFATWCGPCKMVGPIVDELASEYAGKMKFGKLNVDESSETAGQYDVMSIPTLIIFKDGQIVKQMLGAHSKDGFKKEIDAVLA
jgi:thioredoxin 1